MFLKPLGLSSAAPALAEDGFDLICDELWQYGLDRGADLHADRPLHSVDQLLRGDAGRARHATTPGHSSLLAPQVVRHLRDPESLGHLCPRATWAPVSHSR